MTDIKPGPWIEWKGGKCPLNPTVLHQRRYRDGAEGGWTTTRNAGPLQWKHDGGNADIVAYRLERVSPDDMVTEIDNIRNSLVTAQMVYLEAQQSLNYKRRFDLEGSNSDYKYYRKLLDEVTEKQTAMNRLERLLIEACLELARESSNLISVKHK